MCPTGSDVRRYSNTTVKKDFRPAFDVLDADHDGRISREDLRTFYDGFGGGEASSGEDVIGTMMSVADENKDGYVEYDEFERVLLIKKGRERKNGGGERNGRGGGGGGVMEDVFRVMDRDGDGKVGHEDLKSYLSWAGFETSDDDIKAMIKLGGGDEKEGVTYDGLRKILAV
ncbi:calcium-binding protein CP1-like [Cornus florida]|uniref:calcium-binding protein CP1-like n=1 Tax=Cornus florida TaxID=4283 RepID=UPI0028A0A7C1|nr:calcium-binding protein CP1-like [Cornus florida]